MTNQDINTTSIESIARSLASIAVSLESQALQAAPTRADLYKLREAYKAAQDGLDKEYVDHV